MHLQLACTLCDKALPLTSSSMFHSREIRGKFEVVVLGSQVKSLDAWMLVDEWMSTDNLGKWSSLQCNLNMYYLVRYINRLLFLFQNWSTQHNYFSPVNYWSPNTRFSCLSIICCSHNYCFSLLRHAMMSLIHHQLYMQCTYVYCVWSILPWAFWRCSCRFLACW